MIEIKQADRNNFREISMDSFDRFQEVQNVWRIENGRLVLEFHPFTETWSPEQRRKKAGEISTARAAAPERANTISRCFLNVKS